MTDDVALAGVAAPKSDGAPVQTRRGARWTLAILIAAALSVLVTRELLTLVIDDLKRDLNVTDFQISLAVGLGPALVALFVGLPLSWLADKRDRSLLLCGCFIVWTVATAATGLAQSFWQLTAASVAIAVGQSLLGPLTYSIIPDLFSGRARDVANQVYYGVLVVGSGVGLMASGALLGAVVSYHSQLPTALAATPGWRLVFFAIAAPGVLLAFASLFTRVGRASKAATSSEKPIGLTSFLRAHWPALGRVYVGVGLYTFAMGAVNLWLPIALVRATGASAAAVGVNLGMVSVGAAVLGVAAAIASVPFLRERFPVIYPSRVMAIAFALAMLPLLALPFVSSPIQAYGLISVQAFISVVGAAYSPTLFQSMAPSHLRARVIAMGSMLVAGVGMLGPVIVGALSADPAGRGLLLSLAGVAVPALALAAFLIRSAEPSLRVLVAEVDQSPATAR